MCFRFSRSLWFFACFYELRAQHLTPGGISNTLNCIDIYDEIKESFIYSSMYVFQENHRFKKVVSYNHQNISLLTTLLLWCGDIETCSGPVILSKLCKCRECRLKFVHQNICGLVYNFTTLQVLVYKEGSKIDVLLLSETNIGDGDEITYHGLFKIVGYTLLKRNRSHGKGGGVAMYGKNST